MAETSYYLTHMMLGAVGRSGTLDVSTVKSEMARAAYAAPQGEIRLDPENSHFYLWPRIAEVQEGGDFTIIAESRSAVKPDPYLINHTLQDWEPVPAVDIGARIVEG
jgi:branched-chain amino acid transport system substrate-binding protein